MAGDIRISVVRFQNPNVTGTADITGDLGGATPKLAIFLITRHVDGSGDVQAHSEIGIGATDGTRQFSMTILDNDNQNTTASASRSNATHCIIREVGDGNVGLAGQFSAFGADKITINWTTASAADLNLICILIGGADFQAYVGTLAVDASEATTAPGFKPSAIMVASIGATAAAIGHAATSGDFDISFGFATNDGSNGVADQGFISHNFNDNTNNLSRSVLVSTSAVASCSTNGGIFVNCTAFSDTGFTLGASSGTQTVAYVAMQFNGISASLDLLDTKTTTGAQKYTVGLQPVGGILVTSAATGTGLSAGTDDACGGGLGAFNALGAMGAVSIQGDNSSDPTDCESSCLDHALMSGITGGNANSVVADISAVHADSFTLNYSATNGTARKFLAFTFGLEAAPPKPPHGGGKPPKDPPGQKKKEWFRKDYSENDPHFAAVQASGPVFIFPAQAADGAGAEALGRRRRGAMRPEERRREREEFYLPPGKWIKKTDAPTIEEVKELYAEARAEIPAELQSGLLPQALLRQGKSNKVLPPASKVDFAKLTADFSTLRNIIETLARIEAEKERTRQRRIRDEETLLFILNAIEDD